MKIGLRTIKTGIAVSLAMLISIFMGTESPFYVVIAAIIAMQPTVSDSWKMGLNRMLGTFLGVIIGLAFAYTLPINFITLGIGVIVLIYILNRFNWREAISIASVVFIGIFLNEGADHLQHAIGRLIDTFIGIGVAVVINYSIFPPTYDNKIINEINRISSHLWNYMDEILEIYLENGEEGKRVLNEELNEIETVLGESRKFLSMQIKEEKILIYGKHRCKDLVSFVTGADEIFQNLLNIDRVFQTGIKTEVINLIYEEFMDIKQSVKDLKSKGVLLIGSSNGDYEDVEQLFIKVKTAKTNLKYNEKINEYQADDVVKILVLLYNFESLLRKLKTMKSN